MLLTAGVEGDWSYNSSVTFTCDNGYYVTIDMPMICSSDGFWNGTKPACTRVTCSPPVMPDNGSYVPVQTTYNYTETVQFSCLPGFDRIGAELAYCNAAGEWSDISPICQIEDCGSLIDPGNGSVWHTDGTTFGETAFYNCSEGFQLNGTEFRTCNASGNWTFESPTCDVIGKLYIKRIDS